MYVKPGSTIRSDGWKGYNNLHMPEAVETTVNANGTTSRNLLSRSEGPCLYKHQVENHSQHLATYDQVVQNGTEGFINANCIEGMWGAVKNIITKAHRTQEIGLFKKGFDYILLEKLDPPIFFFRLQGRYCRWH
jgi:hypothetical protein